MTPAETWHDALRRAGNLDPDRIARAVLDHTDTGLRATSYDRDGGRTTRTPCEQPERCDNGPDHHHGALCDDCDGEGTQEAT